MLYASATQERAGISRRGDRWLGGEVDTENGLVIFGAPPDTYNLGVSALLGSTLAAIHRLVPTGGSATARPVIIGRS